MKRRTPLLVPPIAASPVLAQTPMTTADGFEAGLMLPWLFAEQTVALVAAGLFLGQSRNAAFLKFWPLFLVAMVAGLIVPPAFVDLQWLSTALLCGAVVLALLVAIRPRLPVSAAVVVAVWAGLTEGIASAPDSADWTVTAGMAAGSILRANLFLLSACALARLLSLRNHAGWLPVVTRVIGSWVAAISLLMLALQFAAPM